MSGNSFGNAFKLMTFGESHGPFIGLVMEGIQPGLPINTEAIQAELDRRKPGQSDIVTPRKEADEVQLVSGVFEGKTTGTPICMLIKNSDQRSKDYSKLAQILRPGHAAYTFLQKYGIFDYRGGGRASGRETATRVAAGAFAKQILARKNIEIYAYTRKIGKIESSLVNLDIIEKNKVRAADAGAAKKMEAEIRQYQESGDSIGGEIEILVKNCPAGLGEPVFNKLDADLAQALMSIGAVKAFEMGSGFKSAEMSGSENNDLYYLDGKSQRFRTRSNNAGGVLGGISNGEDLIMRIAVKAPSSINKVQKTVDVTGNEVDLSVGGRHDPCICPRVVPVAENMAALVILDHLLMQERMQTRKETEVTREQIKDIDRQILLMLAQRKNLVRSLSGNSAAENTVRIHSDDDLNSFCKTSGLSADAVSDIIKMLDKNSAGAAK